MKLNKFLTFIKVLLLVLTVTGAISLATTYAILKVNVDKKLGVLDKTARLVSGQIKSANLNSILAFTNDFTIFIIHERDGRILFESVKRANQDKAHWDQAKPSLIKEMLQKKEGILSYPMIERWQILSNQKTVRFLPLTDLGWIVAVELPATVTPSQIKGIYSSMVLAIFILFSMGLSILITSFRSRADELDIAAVTKQKKSAPATPGPPNKLIEEAQKALSNEEKEVLKKPVVNEVIAAQKKEETLSPKAEDEGRSPKLESAEEIKKAKQDEANPADEKQGKDKKKSHSEIYFDKIMEQKKVKKPKPDTIIGIALTKKNNREKMDS